MEFSIFYSILFLYILWFELNNPIKFIVLQIFKYMKKHFNHSVLKDDEINWEATEKLRKDPKLITFNKWASDNGIIAPNV